MRKSDLKKHFDTLEINEDSDLDEIKSAYRKQAKKYHPDLNTEDPDANEKFKKVKKAYDSLKDSNEIGTEPASFKDFIDEFFGNFESIFKKSRKRRPSPFNSFNRSTSRHNKRGLDTPSHFVNIEDDIRNKERKRSKDPFDVIDREVKKFFEDFW